MNEVRAEVPRSPIRKENLMNSDMIIEVREGLK